MCDRCKEWESLFDRMDKVAVATCDGWKDAIDAAVFWRAGCIVLAVALMVCLAVK